MSVRDGFTVIKKGPSSYWVSCNVCGRLSKGWDYRSNALAKGYAHVVNRHFPTWLTSNTEFQEEAA
jgi:hypothetical protein